MRQNRKIRLGAICGIFAPTVALISITVAIVFYPAFNWENNALSDLGVVSGITGPVFNFGLFAAGLLAFIFAVFGLFNFFKSWVGKAGSILFAVTAISLMAIGVFNENFSPTHYIVSVAFFASAPLSLFVITGAFGLSRQLKLAVFTVFVGVAAAIPWILEFTVHYVPNVAIPEIVSGLAVSVWVIILCKKMLSIKDSV
jgi:hypothetical membrane protein